MVLLTILCHDGTSFSFLFLNIDSSLKRGEQYIRPFQDIKMYCARLYRQPLEESSLHKRQNMSSFKFVHVIDQQSTLSGSFKAPPNQRNFFSDMDSNMESLRFCCCNVASSLIRNHPDSRDENSWRGCCPGLSIVAANSFHDFEVIKISQTQSSSFFFCFIAALILEPHLRRQ